MADSDRLHLVSENVITEPTQDYYEETAVEHLRIKINWSHTPASADITILKRLPFEFASKIKQAKRFEKARSAMEDLISKNFDLPTDFQFEDKLLKESTDQENTQAQSASREFGDFAETVFAALSKIEATVIANQNLLMATLPGKGFSADEIESLKKQYAADYKEFELNFSKIYSEKMKIIKEK